jgi:hypothetical protein
VAIYDIEGKLIKKFQPAFRNQQSAIEWDAQGSPAGVYLVRLRHGGAVFQKKIILMK